MQQKHYKVEVNNIFKLFCKEDDYRAFTWTPFLKNGRIFATDAHALIVCDKENYDVDSLVTFEGEIPDVEKVLKTPNMNVLLNLSKQDFEVFKTKDELQKVADERKCKTCRGEGEVEWEFKHWNKDFDCPACDGDGLETRAKYEKTGKKTFDHKSLVKLFDFHFEMALFYKLLQVHEVTGGEIRLIYKNQLRDGCIFRIGFCTVVLMPYYYESGDGERDVLEINPLVENESIDSEPLTNNHG